MIASVEGVLQSRGKTCVVTVGGLGLAVTITAGAAAALPPVGDTIKLWTHLSVRDDGWTLYGFTDPDELVLFRLLISVSGVGPKLALGMLAGATAPAIAHALQTGDEKALVAMPGIGRKSAARLIVELGQKVPPALLAAGPRTPRDSAEPGDEPPNMAVALELLGAMGLTGDRAGRILRAAVCEDRELAADPVRWVRAALRELS
ncbi:Holliday junction branch migration protein RuvA [bacterium]|nr:Holliday junction branch migration protein RuvA [bacterium]MBU1675017.1 Holliday junction branch migration protein RuvA [bacterium]